VGAKREERLGHRHAQRLGRRDHGADCEFVRMHDEREQLHLGDRVAHGEEHVAPLLLAALGDDEAAQRRVDEAVHASTVPSSYASAPHSVPAK
jgi:hypothetical protein